MNACPGPAPFDPVAEPCCEEHDIALARAAALCAKDWRRLASHAGVHPADFRRFLQGLASLTHENRRRIRENIGGGA